MAMLKVRFQPRSGCFQRGLSLIEVLIALLVLSIGMVGLGALLLTSLSNVHSSSHYSLASALALDVEERLWFETAAISANSPGALGDDGCLDASQIESVIDEMVTQWSLAGSHWGWTGARRLQLPANFTVVAASDDIQHVSNAVNNPGIFWTIVPFAVDWQEARFEDLDGQGEQYLARVAIPCRPVFD